MMRIRPFALAAMALLATSAAPVLAQSDFPNKPIRVVVGFAAGGGNDLFARLVLQKFQEQTGASAVVENKPGAGGRIASDYVAHQPADGYTVLVGATGQMSIASAIYPNLNYNGAKSFTPLAMIASFPLVMVVSTQSGINSVKELIAYGKANPDKSNYGTSSPAFTIACELFKLKTGMPGVPIPYKSTNESSLSLVAGQTLFTIADPPPVVPLAQGGKIKALAVTGSARSPELPDVPSMAEAGYPDIDIHLWSGFFAPTGTPQPIVDKLTKELSRAIADPAVQDGLKRMATTPGGPTGEAFRKRIEGEIKSFSDVVTAAKLKFEQ